MTCLEEGSLTLPSAVKDFRAVFVGDDRVTLEWDIAKSKNVKQYEVYYKEVMNNSLAVDLFADNKVS